MPSQIERRRGPKLTKRAGPQKSEADGTGLAPVAGDLLCASGAQQLGAYQPLSVCLSPSLCLSLSSSLSLSPLLSSHEFKASARRQMSLRGEDVMSLAGELHVAPGLSRGVRGDGLVRAGSVSKRGVGIQRIHKGTGGYS